MAGVNVHPGVEEALAQASEENGLPVYYRDCVRPLLRDGPWPRCCGGGCEPCAETLMRVARRVYELLGVPAPHAP
jgi:hypothetical protein